MACSDTAAVPLVLLVLLVCVCSNDAFGKKVFPNAAFGSDPDSGPFYVGTITPVLHYSMGGLRIDAKAHVLHEGTGAVVPRLFAAGEVTGGIHGNNRLAGMALTECVVYGLMAARTILDEAHAHAAAAAAASSAAPSVSVAGSAVPAGTGVGTPAGGAGAAATAGAGADSLRRITAAELAHNNGEGGRPLWLALFGSVYDMTDFADEHPGGRDSIDSVAGKDGTKSFSTVHSRPMLEDFTPIGVLSSE